MGAVMLLAERMVYVTVLAAVACLSNAVAVGRQIEERQILRDVLCGADAACVAELEAKQGW